MTSETAVAPASPTAGVDAVPVSDVIPSEFGGYRVVRVLSRSEWSTTAVVHGLGETRVARIFSAACPTELIDRELAVHDVIARAEPALREHAVALHDLVTLADRRLALIVELAAGPKLSDVLMTRHGELAIGEAVTILAPLADALETAHDTGLTGLSLTPAAVRFSTTGAPVITRLTDARPGPVLPERFRALEPAYANDIGRFQLLGAAVTAAVVDADRPGLAATLAAPRSTRPLSAALFDLAVPLPVVLHVPAASESEPAPAAQPAPTAPTWPIVPTAVPPAPSSASRARSALSVTSEAPRWIASALDTLSVLGLPMSVVERVQSVAQGVVERATGVGELAAPMVERVRRVRRGYLVAGAGGVVALATAFALVALGAGAGGVGPVADEGGVVESRDEASAPVASDGAVDDSASPAREAPETSTRALDGLAPESLVDPRAEEWPAIIEELVDRWRECHAALITADPGTDPGDDLSCASEVVHAGSAAAQLIGVNDARHEVLERWRNQGGGSVVTERMGGAALIDLVVPTAAEATGSAPTAATTAASLLVVRSEAGWRVRDVLFEDPVD